ncbi:MAG: metallophosphoesterase [Peptococcaceae bacterium]|nr:metallophosphoesterase [Peptococcaceae bacterium]
MGTYIRIFGSFFVIIYLLLNYYIGLRSFQAFRAYYPPLKSFVFWPVFLIISFAYILDRVIDAKIPFLTVAGSYWLAAFVYLFLSFLLIDALGLLNWAFKILPSAWSILWESKKIYVLGLLLTAGILPVGTWLAQNPQISKYDISIAKKPDGINDLKVVLISDLHVEGPARTDFMNRAAKTIISLNPDLIVIAGDLVEGSIDEATQAKLSDILGNLKATYGIYACLGNHDYFGGKADQITSFLENRGIKVLRDAFQEAIDGKVIIAGREDYRSRNAGSGQRKGLEEILAGTDPNKPLILLDHQPENIKEAQNAGVNLMLSGHTHGGQLFPAQFVTKSLFLIDRGVWTEGDFNLIVSTGLGLWGPPVRTSARSEIVEINLHFTDPSEK